MKDSRKTKAQLINELEEARSELTSLRVKKNPSTAIEAQTYLDLAGVMLVALDPYGSVTVANRKTCEVLGYSERELIGKNWFDTCLPEHLRETVKNFSKQLQQGKTEPVEYYENPVLTKSGNERFIAWHNRVLRDATGAITGHLSSGEDITERKAAQKEQIELKEQLYHSQKMEAVGRLAGGVAHDFNNMLCVITGNIVLALDSVAKQDPLYEIFEDITLAAERGSDLTRQLLTFSRKQIVEPKILDLSDLIIGMHSMLVRLIGEDIILRTIPNKTLGRIKVDPGQIEQIILNLAINARDAMPDGGELSIETSNITLNEEYCSTHSAIVPGDYVMLAVSDTGLGMSAETREKIFEPFFTTKSKGKGTGLGLATVYGIVKQSGGYIEVYSEPSEGTTFKIYLPHTTAKADDLSQEDKEQLVGGNETIMVVEDEDLVRTIAAKTLTSLGYNVLKAACGGDALRLSSRHKGHIDILLTDVVMPHMNGRELAERFTKLRPETKVLYTSGYTDNIIVHQDISYEGLNFIPKPFNRRELALQIRKTLGKK